MSINPETRMVTCTVCADNKTRSRYGICTNCRPEVTPTERPKRPCVWCGVGTRSPDFICRPCQPLQRLSLSQPEYADGLTRGTWHGRPGGIKVWISWDEVA